jgi:hypothetical protein
MHLPQECIAHMGNVSQKDISKMENGKKEIPPEFLNNLVKGFRYAASLKAQHVFEKKTEFFSVPYLNAVDKHVSQIKRYKRSLPGI